MFPQYISTLTNIMIPSDPFMFDARTYSGSDTQPFGRSPAAFQLGYMTLALLFGCLASDGRWKTVRKPIGRMGFHGIYC